MPVWTQKRNTQTGGVSSIIAGSNITISPSGGTGNVTINASGALPVGGLNAIQVDNGAGGLNGNNAYASLNPDTGDFILSSPVYSSGFFNFSNGGVLNMGDYNSSLNNTYISVDDPFQTISFHGLGSTLVSINANDGSLFFNPPTNNVGGIYINKGSDGQMQIGQGDNEGNIQLSFYREGASLSMLDDNGALSGFFNEFSNTTMLKGNASISIDDSGVVKIFDMSTSGIVLDGSGAVLLQSSLTTQGSITGPMNTLDDGAGNTTIAGYIWPEGGVKDYLGNFGTDGQVFGKSAGQTAWITPSVSSVTGTLPVASGGTNITSYAVGDIIYASGTTTLSKLADVATGNALISGGVTTAPSWGKIGLTTHVSGILPLANGGITFTTADPINQTATNSSVVTATSPNDGLNHSYQIGAYINVTSISAGTVTITYTFTDEANNSRTLTLFPMGLTSASISTAGFIAFPTSTIRVKANTAITMVATFTGVSISYDTGGSIARLN